jgi:catechol 2,3-dioxygenase-like lactoylglutathione lyase family enzyme
MTNPVKCEITNVALTVADLELTTRFYCEGLGFTELPTLIIGDELAKLAGIEGEFKLYERFIRGGDTVINLLYTETPKIAETRAKSRHGMLGLSHIVIRVDDFENALARIVEYGGAVHEETRAYFDNPDPAVGRTHIINCSDPEGNRVEVLSMPDSVRAWMLTPKSAG